MWRFYQKLKCSFLLLKSVDQFGMSACGPTAVCNVILGLLTIHRKSKELIDSGTLDDLEQLLDPEILSKGIPPRLRDYNAPLGVHSPNKMNLFHFP